MPLLLSPFDKQLCRSTERNIRDILKCLRCPEPNIRYPVHHRINQYPGFHPRQRRTETEMHAVSESEMLGGIRALCIEGFGVSEGAFIVAGGAQMNQHDCAGGKVYT